MMGLVPATERECGHRLADRPVSRMQQFVVTLLVFLFFEVGYLWSGSGHSRFSAWDGAIWLDQQIPQIPFFILFYMLGYLFVLSPAFLLRNRQDFESGITVFVSMLVVAFLCFHFFPVYMHKQIATGQDFFSVLTRHQQRVDVPFNNLPSLHVALNLFAWCLVFYRAGKHALWWLPLPVCIVASTLLVKQHLVLDVVGGIGLAVTGFVGWLWLRRQGFSTWTYRITLSLVVLVLLVNGERVLTGIHIALGLLGKSLGIN